MQKQQSSPPAGRAPWWKFGHVWLVLAGPAAVAVGCVLTTWIALSNPDPVVAAYYYLRLIKVMWFDPAPGATDHPPAEARAIACGLALFSFPLVMVALTWLEPLARAAAVGYGAG